MSGTGTLRIIIIVHTSRMHFSDVPPSTFQLTTISDASRSSPPLSSLSAPCLPFWPPTDHHPLIHTVSLSVTPRVRRVANIIHVPSSQHVRVIPVIELLPRESTYAVGKKALDPFILVIFLCTQWLRLAAAYRGPICPPTRFSWFLSSYLLIAAHQHK